VIRRCPTLLTKIAVATAFCFGIQPARSQADGIVNYTLTTQTAIPAASGPLPGTPSVTLNSALTNGSTSVTVPSTSGVAVGYLVSGTGIPNGTMVSGIGSGGSQITLSQDATVSNTESLLFSPNIAPPQIVAAIDPVGSVPAPAATATEGPLTILAGSQGFTQGGVYDFLNTPKDANGNLLQPIALGLSFYTTPSGPGGLAAASNGGVVNFSLDVANPNSPPQLVTNLSGVSITLQPAASTTGSGGTTDTGTGGGGQITTENVPEPLSVLVWGALAGAGLMRRRASQKRCSTAL
jgi:hypothetical protein